MIYIKCNDNHKCMNNAHNFGNINRKYNKKIYAD